MTIRAPAVAGMFYSADAAQLRTELAAMLQTAGDAADNGPDPLPPKVLIVPHAGYRYSGPIAASAYRLLAPLRSRISKVVLVGPAHRVYLEGMAVPTADAFATPLGQIKLDTAAIAAVKKLPGVCVSDAAHKDEHSLEVQLPFLQLLLDNVELLPVVVGQCPPARVASMLDRVWGGPETLIIISTDLSHFLAYGRAQQTDRATCRKICSKSVNISGDEACGAFVLNGLFTSQLAQALQADTLDVRNSGDTAGDKSQVVGYGAFALH